jgi:hypothetical protein
MKNRGGAVSADALGQRRHHVSQSRRRRRDMAAKRAIARFCVLDNIPPVFHARTCPGTLRLAARAAVALRQILSENLDRR